MTRDTSIEAYHKMRDQGLLGRRRLEIYEIVCLHGPMTANQAFQYLDKSYRADGRVFRFDSNTRARFTELREMGALEERGEVVCPVSGMNVINWAITGSLAHKREKQPTKTEIIKHLEKENAGLRDKLQRAQTVIDALNSLLSEDDLDLDEFAAFNAYFIMCDALKLFNESTGSSCR